MRAKRARRDVDRRADLRRFDDQKRRAPTSPRLSFMRPSLSFAVLLPAHHNLVHDMLELWWTRAACPARICYGPFTCSTTHRAQADRLATGSKGSWSFNLGPLGQVSPSLPYQRTQPLDHQPSTQSLTPPSPPPTNPHSRTGSAIQRNHTHAVLLLALCASAGLGLDRLWTGGGRCEQQ